MGEMADDAFDRAMDELLDGDEDQWFDGPYGHDHMPGYDRKHNVTCARCGADGLKWRMNEAGEWRLYEETRVEGNRKKQHECNPASADDFEDIS